MQFTAWKQVETAWRSDAFETALCQNRHLSIWDNAEGKNSLRGFKTPRRLARPQSLQNFTKIVLLQPPS